MFENSMIPVKKNNIPELYVHFCRSHINLHLPFSDSVVSVCTTLLVNVSHDLIALEHKKKQFREGAFSHHVSIL